MTTRLEQAAHTEAVAATLEQTGLPVGRGIRNTEQDGTGQPITPPCYVLHPILGGTRTGVLDDAGRHASLVYQVTCYGATQAQCEWARDQSEILLDGVEVEGRLIDIVRADFGSSDALRDDTVGSPFFTAHPRYRLHSTPG